MCKAKVLATDTATRCWGKNLPDWVRTLAEECDRLGAQTKAAKKIGYSAAAVNLVLKANYKGLYKNVENAVRTALMGITIICPVKGEIKLSECIKHQTSPLITSNPTKLKLWRNCRGGCVNFKGGDYAE